MNGLEHLPSHNWDSKQQREKIRCTAEKEGTPDPDNSEPSRPNSQSNHANDLPDWQSPRQTNPHHRRGSNGLRRRHEVRSRQIQHTSAGSGPPDRSRARAAGGTAEGFSWGGPEEGGGVANLLRRRRPSSCTAAPSPARPGHRRRGSEACEGALLVVPEWRGGASTRAGKDGGRDRFARGVGRSEDLGR